jgi:hypothetical protein
MKFGAKPPKIWHETNELKSAFSRLNSQVNRLILLESLWAKTAGSKTRYWQLYAVKVGTVFVEVKVIAARHELLLKEKQLISELNKNFEKPWIKKISII